MTSRSRDLSTRLAATALLLAAFAGCGDGDDPGADATSPSTTESEPTSDATESEPTSEPTPTIEPATGPVVRNRFGTLRVPDTWKTKGSELFTDAERAPRRGSDIERDVYGFIDLDLDEESGPLTLDQAAKFAAGISTVEGKRIEDAELGGEPAFVITKSTAFGDTSYTTGLWVEGQVLTVDFSLLGVEKRDRMELINSVLATWEWRP